MPASPCPGTWVLEPASCSPEPVRPHWKHISSLSKHLMSLGLSQALGYGLRDFAITSPAISLEWRVTRQYAKGQGGGVKTSSGILRRVYPGFFHCHPLSQATGRGRHGFEPEAPLSLQMWKHLDIRSQDKDLDLDPRQGLSLLF